MSEKIRVYAHPNGDSWKAIEEAVKTANGLQLYFSFELIELREGLSGRKKSIRPAQLEKKLRRAVPEVRGIIFCDERTMGETVVIEVLPHRIYVMSLGDGSIEAPPFRLYVLYQLAAASLTLAARLSQSLNKQMLHNPPVGCLWDWWKNPVERGASMVAARLCLKCQNALILHGNMTEEALVAAKQLLDYMRRSIMGEAPQIPNRVFIAYGHGDDWMPLRDMLVGWGLDVEYFERKATVGVVVTERWRQMLNQARFAFALMTPDEQMADGRRCARQNVVHEIGLCHARLGIQSTAILIAEGTERFSNVSGVIHIEFKSGQLIAKKQEIRKLLQDRGIL